MEIHFFPSNRAVLQREGILRSFENADLSPTTSEDAEFWQVSFGNSSVFIDFQHKDGRLYFATLEMPILSEDRTSHAAFVALEDMGWVALED